MSDLISREALLADLEHGKSICKGLVELLFFDAVMAMVDNQPIAYDVEKVMDKLGEMADRYDSESTSDVFTRFGLSIAIEMISDELDS